MMSRPVPHERGGKPSPRAAVLCEPPADPEIIVRTVDEPAGQAAVARLVGRLA